MAVNLSKSSDSKWASKKQEVLNFFISNDKSLMIDKTSLRDNVNFSRSVILDLIN